MKGQLSRTQDERQDRIERPLAAAGRSLALLEHDGLRVSQAIDRHSSLVHLLEPVLDDLEEIQNAIREIQELLREEWERGQACRWNG